MGSLIAGMLDALGPPSGLAGDTAPYVPSAPVEIGTPGMRHGPAEIGSWQGLMVMFAVVLALGAVVLMYVVRQRTRLLARRRVRRMAQAVRPVAADGEVGAAAPKISATKISTTSPKAATTPTLSIPITTLTLTRTPSAPPRTTPATPGRPAPNA